MRPIRFTKMHGIGNDYIYINAFEERIDNPASLAKVLSDRHFGVGGDGIILICPPSQGVQADVRMRMFNADGSESEMCGNGIRCVCKYAHDHGLSKANPMRIETGRGVLTLEYTLDGEGHVAQVTVDMGEPIWKAAEVGVRVEFLDDLLVQVDEAIRGDLQRVTRIDRSEAVSEGFQAMAERTSAAPACQWLSMGNPHIVFFVQDVRRVPLQHVGPMIELHHAFPRRINAHFVQIHSRREVTMRTWERGSGITLACGTGASAVCVAGASLDLTDREILAHLPGGDLHLNWEKESNHVFKTGPATEVFEGTWDPSWSA